MSRDDRFDELIHRLTKEADDENMPAAAPGRPADSPVPPRPAEPSQPAPSRPAQEGRFQFAPAAAEAPQPAKPAAAPRPAEPSQPTPSRPAQEGRFQFAPAAAEAPAQPPRQAVPVQSQRAVPPVQNQPAVPPPQPQQQTAPAQPPRQVMPVQSRRAVPPAQSAQPTPMSRPQSPPPPAGDKWDAAADLVSGAEVAGDLKNTMAAKETKSDFRMHIHNNEFDNIPDPPQAKSREPRRRPQRQSVLDGRFGGLIRFAQSFSAVLIVLGISAFLAYFTLVSASDLFGLNQPDEQVTVTIPKDASYNDFIRLLGDSGVVDQPFTFRLYAGFKNLGDSFRGGVYTMNKDFSYDEIIDLLTRGDGSDIARITIIEGMTINNIADKLEEENVCSAKDFLEALNTGDFEYEFMKDVPKSPLRFHEYEGYMFPDTYEFYMGEQPMTVVKKFFANFQKRVYKENILERMENSGMSMDEVITLASVIQKESGTFADMEKVSSIFHNRLAADSPYPLLQSDVTIFYVNDNIKPTDSQENPNQEMYDAYNTYVKHGLPVGPICNPGMEAIEAALAPAETEFYFFVTDAEGTYYYAKTLEEHERNCNIAKAKGEMVGVATEKPETE